MQRLGYGKTASKETEKQVDRLQDNANQSG